MTLNRIKNQQFDKLNKQFERQTRFARVEHVTEEYEMDEDIFQPIQYPYSLIVGLSNGDCIRFVNEDAVRNIISSVVDDVGGKTDNE